MDHQLTGVFTKVEEVRYTCILAEFNKKKKNGHLYKLRGHSLYFLKKNHVFLSPKIVFVIANSEDPDQMSHLGQNCLSKYGFRRQ